MKARIAPALCILTLGILSSVIVLTADALTGDWVVHIGATVLAAGILAMIATVQNWIHFAWLPVLGFAVASGALVAGQTGLIYVGLFMFTILTVWHGHQQEGNGGINRRQEAPA